MVRRFLLLLVSVGLMTTVVSGHRPKGAQVRDHIAGVAYDIPKGWTAQQQGLIDFFTSTVASPSSEERAEEQGDANEEEPEALVGAGLFKSTFYDPGRSGLRAAAVATAQGFAEFFIPPSEHRPVRRDEATKVDGRAAWCADYSVQPDDPGERPAKVTLIAVDSPTPFYLMAVHSGGAAHLEKAVERVLASAEIIPATDAAPPAPA